MSTVGQTERRTQEQIVRLFRHRLGYDYGGNWSKREENSHVMEQLLRHNLATRGYDEVLIGKAVLELKRQASLGGGRRLYEANRDVYESLRYGVKVKPGLGEHTETVWLIDWENPEANHFMVAEEVTITEKTTKRPDVVVYVNGLALGVIELKRSTVSVSEGIRQNLGNQKEDFIPSFFTTVQLVMAGNDTEGLRYGVIDTKEKYWLEWKEDSEISEPLDRAIVQMCAKDRFLEIIHDFMVFDAGTKKTCRHNQFFGVKAAQERITKREGGIIWHTQGSGKSLTMVWLAKWIREHQPEARVLLITDRTELDKQIEKVFNGVSEQIYRATSGADLIGTLNSHDPWLLCSLVYKFGGSESEKDRDKSSEEFMADMNSAALSGFSAKGNIFVFVDEAHRTQSGKMHDAMKQLLPDAMFIGFTGTPLLKADKATSIETFGRFIHCYKFNEAVEDGVVLDLRYEARNIDQYLTSPEKVDKWFEAKTKGMTDLSKAELKKRWGTVQKVVTSEPRAKQIATDILYDFETKPRLMDGRGNAMLVSSSIYQACKFYELFCDLGFEGQCAIVTSYVPQPGDIAKEDSGAGKTEAIRQYKTYRKMLADYFDEPANIAVTKIEKFEESVKERFIKDPGQMRLLIVVDKLLTGFDAPSATYLYIDKTMRDHGLFQAICRVNRLDGDDKDYGYIVDYQDLFRSLENAITDYTFGALDGYEKKDIEGLLKDRLAQARKDLDEALEHIRALCELVEPPKGTLEYQHYFVGDESSSAEQIKTTEPRRVALYKAVSQLTRAYTNIANDMNEAGYTDAKAAAIVGEVKHYTNVRAVVKITAREDVDFKQYEAGMRHLLDAYVQAGSSEVLADFQDHGLIGLIVQRGTAAIDSLPPGIRKDPQAVAETIEKNVRKVLVDEHAMDPKYYDKMSALLDAIIEQRRQGATDYKEYLKKITQFTQGLIARDTDEDYPDWATDGAQQALVSNFAWTDPETPRQIDMAIRSSKPHNWVGKPVKEKKVAQAILEVLPPDFDEFDDLFKLVKKRNEYR